MAKQKLQLQHLPKFNLRLQPDLKATLERLAKAVPHSLNSEIVQRLEQSLVTTKALQDYSDGELIDEMIRRYGRDGVYIQLGTNNDSQKSQDTPLT